MGVSVKSVDNRDLEFCKVDGAGHLIFTDLPD